MIERGKVGKKYLGGQCFLSLHEGKAERVRLKFGPTKSARIVGEAQAFRVEAFSVPPKRRRH